MYKDVWFSVCFGVPPLWRQLRISENLKHFPECLQPGCTKVIRDIREEFYYAGKHLFCLPFLWRNSRPSHAFRTRPLRTNCLGKWEITVRWKKSYLFHYFPVYAISAIRKEHVEWYFFSAVSLKHTQSFLPSCPTTTDNSSKLNISM